MEDDKQRVHATRENLIEAAGEIFAEKGLHGARIRDITSRAGANIAAVNYHFRDKTELYAVVLRRVHEDMLSAFESDPTAPTPEARIRELLSAVLASALNPERPEWHRRLLGRELVQPTPALDSMDDMMGRTSRRLRDAVREIRPDFSPKQVVGGASAIVAQCMFYVHHRHVLHRLFPDAEDPTLAEITDYVVEFSLAALHGLPKEDESA